ncbi:two-component sensor histidine kinase [Actibacterium pelagium]|uniref:C4-dicarboxylate transport sensor protein DctB n=2 Tax=Actibacterium pelagium TaxID=2029103 RepID=A0A917ACV6_9RHOB|nr:two-component sensor histidine kinase [Actibacterium pelagium]
MAMVNNPIKEFRVVSGHIGWARRLFVLIMIIMAVSVVVVTNSLLTERFTERTRTLAQVRVALYSGNLMSEVQRASIVPLLLSRDPALIGALNSGDFSSTSQRLISYVEEIGAASLLLLDADGKVVAASNRQLLGSDLSDQPFFLATADNQDTVFVSFETEKGDYEFAYSRQVRSENSTVGVVVVEVDLAQFEQRWAGISDAVAVIDSTGRILLATEPRWRGLTIEEALKVRSAPTAIERAIRVTSDWGVLPTDLYSPESQVMRNEVAMPFEGWQLVSFTTFASVRERVNTFLALEIMGFAILLAFSFYFLSRRAQSRSIFFQRESAELRQLNARLQREIAERERAEKNLEVAEQTLEQSSKLAALGEMSAAVSHELNQPLAAMKTYLAGARLLLERKRGEEALTSFHRIDDLIERMGAITRQLKSYARKGGEAFEPFDLRESLSTSLSMMEPQLRSRDVRISRSVPSEPVFVMGDRLRVEQVIINLLRNAIDATKVVSDAEIELILSVGETATLTVRDNGHGIDNLDDLFEPFYTTKQPGDGTGLGLAISSGIVNDLGGRLTARNGDEGGAVFEMQLPLLDDSMAAAE